MIILYFPANIPFQSIETGALPENLLIYVAHSPNNLIWVSIMGIIEWIAIGIFIGIVVGAILRYFRKK